MKTITNATLVMNDHLIPDAYLIMEQGCIAEFGEMRACPVTKDTDVIDAKGLFLGPGLIDIHTHASDRVFFIDDPVKASQYHLRAGTTTVLPALYFSMNRQEWLSSIKTLRLAMSDPRCINIAGLYMEGPYLNPKFGCDKENNPWRGPIDRSEYGQIIEAAKDLARVWAVAPEREGIYEFVRDVRLACPNAVFAVAHSEAEPFQMEPLLPLGLRLGTHHTDATGTIQKYPEVKGVCVDEFVNYHKEIYAELICDSRGIHVDPFMLRLVRRIKGDDRIILISDAYASDAPKPAGYEGVNDINFDYMGEIAGSKLTLNVAMRNMMNHTGASIVDVFGYASRNPAKAVGFSDRGEIAVGKRADLILTDHLVNVKKIFVKGEEIA
ncbi:MAG: amidohydrolase family protein [Clostridiales bacterium]|nr:amidohydrolase family protein [Clostridiales bacterium]